MVILMTTRPSWSLFGATGVRSVGRGLSRSSSAKAFRAGRLHLQTPLNLSLVSSPSKRRSCAMAAAKVESEKEASEGGGGDFEALPEGSDDFKEGAKDELMKEVMRRISEEDLEEAAKKYKYENELFAQIDFAQINTFTSKAFSGNPAAVCYLPYERDENWMQLIAREFNITATAFVVKRRASRKKGAGGASLLGVDDTGKQLKTVKTTVRPIENEFDLRWFSTTAELKFCGHATLASAHMIFSSGVVEGDMIIFHTKGGTLKARKVTGYDESDVTNEDEEDPKTRKLELGKGVVELDFPLSTVSHVDASESKLVSDAFGGADLLWIGRTASDDYLMELPSSKHVEELRPQFEKLKSLPGRSVIATARTPEGSAFDFTSRCFGPKLGIPEDPVTGSTHCALGPYWAQKLAKDEMKAYQASSRGGEIALRVDFQADRVYLQGGAVLLMAGTLLNTYPR